MVILGRDLQVKCHYMGQHREETKLTTEMTETHKELLNFFNSSTDHYTLRKAKQNRLSRCEMSRSSRPKYDFKSRVELNSCQVKMYN